MWQSFSDFRRAVVQLEKMSRAFQCVDPLQHHGHWVYTDYDLECFDQTEMPLVVLNNAVLITGKSTIHASVRPDANISQTLKSILREVESHLDEITGRGLISLFDLKDLVSAISLLPALAFQVNAQWLDKKSAIERCDEMFSSKGAAAVRWASTIRENWFVVPGYGWSRALSFANHFLPFRRNAMERIARGALPLVSRDEIPFFNDEIAHCARTLCDECGRLPEAVERHEKLQ
jgi:hypothetical protein